MSVVPAEVRAGLLVLVLVVLIWAAMWWGWRGRAGRQQRLAEPRWLSAAGIGDTGSRLRCTYLGTTTAGDWLDRISAHGLGRRGPAELTAAGGELLVHRPGAGGFAIGAAELLSVRREAGIANRLAPRHLGVVVVRWRLGDHIVDTGFQPPDTAGRARIEQLIQRLDQGVSP
ncbi:hypothetical protein BH24ACT11_BH24ACT11_17270 [soil metagenome]